MTERLLIVSADGHIGGRPEDYRRYFDPAYRGAMEDFIAEDAAWNRLTRYEDIAADPEFCGWNVASRLRALDAEGIAAEVVHPGPQGALLPFFTCAYKPCSPELRWAGARAYNRWLADRIDEAGGRLLGVAVLGPVFDADEAVAELEWVRSRGFVAVELPQATWEPKLPPVRDTHYEPVWAACAALGLRVGIHAGWGVEQGRFWEYSKKFLALTGQSQEALEKRTSEDLVFNLMMAGSAPAGEDDIDIALGPRQALWQLMLAGVFDRHPALTAVVTELRADWLPPTLVLLDERCRRAPGKLQRLPSEYFASNCYVTPSSIRDCEVAMRHEIGIDRIMFGSDCPHPEATWPDTLAWLRHAFRDLPEAEIRAILGENALRAYGLERAPLDAVAARIGPTLAQLREGADDDALLSAFDARAGLRSPAERIDEPAVRRLIEKDLVALGTA